MGGLSAGGGPAPRHRGGLAHRADRTHPRRLRRHLWVAKVHAQLRRAGIRVSRKRVERLLRTHGLQGAFMRKRRRSSTRRDPAATPALDLVNRNFKSDAPDRLWVADISRIPTGEGALWLASVRDAFSRRVVGWKASDRAEVELVLDALEYALWSRQVERERLVFHSDSEYVGAGCSWAS
jgi:putative transposase